MTVNKQEANYILNRPGRRPVRLKKLEWVHRS